MKQGLLVVAAAGMLLGGKVLQQQIHHELANDNEFIRVQLIGAERIVQLGGQHLD